jgi:hypothetical protein
MTRLIALKLSPFQITLEVDSDTVACGDMEAVLKNIYAMKYGPMDFSVMSASSDPNNFYPQNGISIICLILGRDALYPFIVIALQAFCSTIAHRSASTNFGRIG